MGQGSAKAAKVVDLSKATKKERSRMVTVFEEELAILVLLRSPRIIQVPPTPASL